MPQDELFVSVDIEATGPIPGEYSMASIGACVVGRPDATFYAELKPISDKADPAALKVCGFTMEHLKSKGEDPAEVMKRFAKWVKDTAGSARPVFVAFNATFDWMFTHWYFEKFAGSDPFGISGLDVKAYYMGMMGVPWAGSTKQQVTKKFETKTKHTHHALDDAKEQAELFGQMLDYQKLKRS